MFGVEPRDFYITDHAKYSGDDHSARDLPHGSWVSINFRGNGSGKRVSTGASKKTDEEKTKDEIIDELKRVIDITLKNVGWIPKSTRVPTCIGTYQAVGR